MGLSNDLITQFVKTTKATAKRNDESTVYGTTKLYDGAIYVQLDGSELLTPVSTTTAVEAGERVAVRIKDHAATITGNISFPAAKNITVQELGDEVATFNKVLADKVSVVELEAVQASIDSLIATDADIYKLTATFITADDVKAKYVSTDQLEADYITASEIDIVYAKIDTVDATYAKIETLESAYATIASVDAVKITVDDLNATKLDAESAKLEYADIGFANIGEAALESFYSKAGIIENLVISDGHITGDLVGVNISGDLIDANTIVADKLVVLGDDGLYYKLNVEGGTFAADEVVPTDSLHGSVITAHSVTAKEIYVDDLVAFDATIGGFKITDSALYSGAKETVDNATQGAYMDSSGQFAIGDADNYLKYYQDDSGNWHLDISAESLLFGSESKASAEDIKALTEHIKLGTYTDPTSGNVQPSIEMSEGDTKFKQVITNTAAMFMDGDEIKTELNTDGLETENLTIRGELRQVEFAWIFDEETGNYDLEWKGAAG